MGSRGNSKSEKRMAASTSMDSTGWRVDLDGEFGRPTEFQHPVLLAQGPIFGHVSSRLAHEPDGGGVDGLAPAGAEKSVVHG